MSAETRQLPALTPDTEAFWTAGAIGELQICRCGDCGRYAHPPTPACPSCLGRHMTPTAVSGRARVISYTINHQPWLPGMVVPFVIAYVELVEQRGLWLMTNIVNCPVSDVTIDMRVRVVFEQHDEIFIPLFEPDDRP